MRTTRRGTLLIGFMAVVTLSACSTGDGNSSIGPQASRVSRSLPALPAPSASDRSVAGVPAQMLSEVVAQAAARADVDPSAVEVLVAEEVTWNDGSLGCPEAGMSYTQALVPGYRVVAQAGGEELHFHAGQSGEFRYCGDPRPPLGDDPND